MKSRPFDETVASLIKDDPALATEMLNVLFEEGDLGGLLIAIRQIAMAQEGGMKSVAEHAAVNTNQLYRTLSNEGNPKLSTFASILDAMGLQLSIQPRSSNHHFAGA